MIAVTETLARLYNHASINSLEQMVINNRVIRFDLVLVLLFTCMHQSTKSNLLKNNTNALMQFKTFLGCSYY